MLKMENYERKEQEASVSDETLSHIKRVIADLRDTDGAVRREARQTLVFIGEPAVDLLIPLLKDPDDDVRWEVAKALIKIADPRAASGLVDLLMDHNFGVRWTAAEALIAIGRDALRPLMEALTKSSDWTWLRKGAHHVLRDLADKDSEVKHLVAPVIAALEAIEPEIGVTEPAYTALDKLKVSNKKAQLKKAKPQE